MELQVNLDMIIRCSFLIAFLFCIDHVAWLEAIGVHNWSSIFNDNPSKTWVVLVAGTNTWNNYRYQADVFHAYQLVRKNKVPAENVITFTYDDIANNRRNPFKGKAFHDYQHKDVYNGVEIDYRGKDVTRDNFLKVLKGDKKLEANMKKVLKICMPWNLTIGSAFKKMFNKLVLYMDTSKSGSMFHDVLPSNMGIYVTTAVNETEDSFSMFCLDKKSDVCLADEYSYEWLLDSDYRPFLEVTQISNGIRLDVQQIFCSLFITSHNYSRSF
ncbi:hypothetical protein T265_10491 [Opisthorchis viverrini]|uniref:Peptidase C13 family protein n=1 Tax=Opisthorchis viverrini TaxID=6198 RepID=A0A074Z234_OPIVI|nr:hypothetical protein T265_10491 [Opisthorchis viverrini]KER21111.1 hypothetical protein T265_10491 [Opisthorchis viverrini]